jgi:hypothetical protein
VGGGNWTVKDGAIVGEAAAPGGWLMSDKDYADFEGVSETPGNATLGVNPLEVAQEKQAEILAWLQAGPAENRGVERLAKPFDERIKLVLRQDLVFVCDVYDKPITDLRNAAAVFRGDGHGENELHQVLHVYPGATHHKGVMFT